MSHDRGAAGRCRTGLGEKFTDPQHMGVVLVSLSLPQAQMSLVALVPRTYSPT